MSDEFLMLRRAVLLQLDAVFPARLAGFDCGLNDVQRNLEYLRQKGLVEIRPSRISASSVRASLTSEGEEYLESGEF